MSAVGGRRVFVEGEAADVAAVGALMLGRGARLVDDPAVADLLICDVWTPAVAPHVLAARARGARVSSLAEIAIAEAGCRVIAVTGTAGKSTTSRLIEAMLRASGLRVHASQDARARQAWPNHELLGLGADPDDWLVVELTSSHLAFMSRPQADIAVVTSFWPDHVELHGGLDAYLDAKLEMVRAQRSGDWLVVVGGDPAIQPFLAASAAGVVAVEVGEVPYAANAALASAAARLAGASEEAIEATRADPPRLPHRLGRVAHVDGVAFYDDSLATTPRKALAAISAITDAGLVVIVGGEENPPTGAVHGSAGEAQALGEALTQMARRARAIVAFGSASQRISAAIACEVVADLGAACERARSLARAGDAVLLAPMFPLSMAEREEYGSWARGLGGTLAWPP